MRAGCALVAFVLVFGVADGAGLCGYHTPTGQYFGLSALKKEPIAAYRVFDNEKIFSFNLCAAAQCGVNSDAPACSQPATPSNPPSMDDFEGIGALEPVAQSLTGMDIADINWKTQHMPPFPTTATGVKLVYPPFGTAPAAPGQQPGAQAFPGAPQGQPGQNPYGQPAQAAPSPPGYAQPPGWGTPAPAPANPWSPTAAPAWGAPPAQQANPYAQQAQPGQQPGAQPGMPPMGKHSTLGMTIMAVCDPQAKAPLAMQFARGQTYKDRGTGYLFVVASAHACPTSPPGDVLGTGLVWGWFFIVAFSIAMGLYCGIGMVYKYKKLGVTGLETIPNIEFWRDYPGLIKDGIAYFISLVKQCLAKGGDAAASGGGSSGGGYSTV